MRKLQLLLVALILTTVSFAHEDEKDPVVLTIDGEGIHKSEFLYIYTKNNPNPSYKKDDLDEYMELFINYKLKVAEAERLGYDTIPKLNSELAQYRKQLSLPYMVDKEKNEDLIKEAYDRTKNEVRASHILIRVKPDATPKDSLAAYNKIIVLRDRILAGEKFGAVATGRGGSEDPSAKTNMGDLGYFSALQMVYAFEDAAFKTPVGEVSMPIRTRFGYHIIKTDDKRASKGKMKGGHIMVLSNETMTDKEKGEAEKKITEIYDLLVEGQKFEDLAIKYSDDQSSKSKGGLLPIFGAGSKQRMVPEFEAAAFGITEDGGYSKPVKTAYGWHIIQRIELLPVASYDDMYRELKLKVEKDIRAQSTKDSFINGIKKEYGFNEGHSNHLLAAFYNTMNNDIFQGRWKGLDSKAHHDEILFEFKDQFFTVVDFEKHLLRLNLQGASQPIKPFIEGQYKAWSTGELMRYEDSQLESKYPEFKSLIQEYRDGILVFEIMQNEIWNKASEDTTGIKNYYEKYSTEFTYPVRYKGELYKCKDKETAKKVYAMVEADSLTFGQIQEKINADSQLNLVVKKHTFNSETTEAFKKGKKARKFKAGLNKIFVRNDEYYVLKVDEILQPRNREFKEAKGLVTAAYQNQLEKDWLAGLRKSHKIEVQEALYDVGK
ncbi:MAG: peptidyl-prolyl cis-trans isomerase SurA [Arenicella sp.]|jgi:peptidyl-prolyl cis-trans isomerase SurA